MELGLLITLPSSQWGALLDFKAIDVHGKQLILMNYLNKNVMNETTYFLKAPFRNTILFLMLFSENNFKLNVIEHLQRTPQFKCTVKSQTSPKSGKLLF